MPVVNTTQSLQAGVINALMETWRQQYPIYKEQQEVLIRFLPQTTIRNASYPFKESVPFPRFWPYGSSRVPQTFRDRVIQLNTVPYELTVPWSKWDEDDDQLGDLRTHIQACTQRFLQLPDLLVSEYINGVASLNPSLTLSYDGASLFSDVDGDGNARLSVTGGNILTGSGLTTAGLVADLAVAQQRFLKMLDPTAGKPIFSADDVAYNKLFVLGPPEANQILQTVAQSEMIWKTGQTVAAESNYLKGTFKWGISSYLTNTKNLYVIAQHAYWRPFAARWNESVESLIADINNSDRARDTNEYALYASLRGRLGVFFPGCIIKINNS